MDSKMPSVSEALEFRRQQYGLSRSEWAYVLGTTPSHYSEVENGKRTLSKKSMARAYAFGVPPSVLFQTDGDKGIAEIRALLAKPATAER